MTGWPTLGRRAGAEVDGQDRRGVTEPTRVQSLGLVPRIGFASSTRPTRPGVTLLSQGQRGRAARSARPGFPELLREPGPVAVGRMHADPDGLIVGQVEAVDQRPPRLDLVSAGNPARHVGQQEASPAHRPAEPSGIPARASTKTVRISPRTSIPRSK